MAPWVCPSALPSQGSISNPPDFNLTSLKFPPILLLQTAHFSFHLSVCCSLLLLWQFYRPFFCSKFLRRTCPHFFAKFGCWHLLFPGAFCVCSLIMKNPCYLGSVPRPLLGQHLPFLHQCVAMSSHCSVPCGADQNTLYWVDSQISVFFNFFLFWSHTWWCSWLTLALCLGIHLGGLGGP